MDGWTSTLSKLYDMGINFIAGSLGLNHLIGILSFVQGQKNVLNK